MKKTKTKKDRRRGIFRTYDRCAACGRATSLSNRYQGSIQVYRCDGCKRLQQANATVLAPVAGIVAMHWG